MGQVEVLKGSKVKDYIFTVCHMIITGKAYEVKYTKKKEDSEKVTIVRKPVDTKKAADSKGKAKKTDSKPAEVSDSETIRVKRTKKAVADEVLSDELPAVEDIPTPEIA